MYRLPSGAVSNDLCTVPEPLRNVPICRGHFNRHLTHLPVLCGYPGYIGGLTRHVPARLSKKRGTDSSRFYHQVAQVSDKFTMLFSTFVLKIFSPFFQGFKVHRLSIDWGKPYFDTLYRLPSGAVSNDLCTVPEPLRNVPICRGHFNRHVTHLPVLCGYPEYMGGRTRHVPARLSKKRGTDSSRFSHQVAQVSDTFTLLFSTFVLNIFTPFFQGFKVHRLSTDW